MRLPLTVFAVLLAAACAATPGEDVPAGSAPGVETRGETAGATAAPGPAPAAKRARRAQPAPEEPAPAPAAPSLAPGADSACGEASYYADSLAGARTASGAPYDPAGFTAAHRTLDFGTPVRVTRTDTGANVIVTITDRGPYAEGRVIDLSRAAAQTLAMIEDGVAPVCLEVL